MTSFFAPDNSRLKFLAGLLILIITASIMLHVSWLKWPDALVDSGRELYIPWQLSEGRVLYKDLEHTYGPFSHYLNAAIFQVFGVSVMALCVFNAVMIGLLTFLIYKIFSAVSDGITAVVSAATFLSVFAFSQYVGTGNYNFAYPYSHEIVHGIIFSFICLWFFIKFVQNKKPLYSCLAGISFGIVALTKVEVFLALSLSLTAGYFLLLISCVETPGKKAWGFSLFAITFLLPPAGFIVYLTSHMPVGNAIGAILYQYRLILEPSLSNNIFYAGVLGSDALCQNVKMLAMVLTAYLVLATITLIPSRIISSRFKKYDKPISFLSVVLIVAGTTILFKTVPWLELLRPLPVFLILFLLYQGNRFFKLRKSDEKACYDRIPVIALTIFALVLLLKNFLNVRVYHYGFALSMPATLIFVMIVLYYFPAATKKWFGNNGFIKTVAMTLTLITLLAHIQISRQWYDLKGQPVGDGNDTILGYKTGFFLRDKIISIAAKKIPEIIPRDATFVALPEGVMLNYLTRRENPCRYFEFTPPPIKMLGEDHFIKTLSECSPDFIVLTHKDTSEHGHQFFGRDYGQKMLAWIKGKYQSVGLIGDPPLKNNRYGIQIFKKIK